MPLTDTLGVPDELRLVVCVPLEVTESEPLRVMVVLTVPDDEMEPEPLADPDGDCDSEPLTL